MVCCHLIAPFGSSFSCYDEVLFVVLLRRFICVGAIETGKTDLISQRYQMMVVSMLKNWSRRYSSHYIIKFVDFMLIYYAINVDIVSSSSIYRSVASCICLPWTIIKES